MGMPTNSFSVGPFEDYSDSPILAPSNGLQSKAVYNPSVIVQNGRFWMPSRAETDDGLTGRIAIAQSKVI
jgi:predicted GH43/DUF377 family glycosyl hydrolase